MLEFIKRKPLAAFVGLLVISYICVSLFRVILDHRMGTLYLVVSPSDATATIDGKSTKYKPGKIKLAPGKHTITVSRAGFADNTSAITLTQGKSTKAQIALSANTATGVKYLRNDDNFLKSEDIVGSEIDRESARLNDTYPILSRLPVNGAGYKMDVGLSRKTPKGDFALYVQCWQANASCQSQVNKWMQSQGFKASDYEYVYINNANT